MDEIVLALAVVTHNSARWVPGLFASWRETVAAVGVNGGRNGVETIVADAGSTDPTAEAVRTAAPEAHLLALSNVGFGAAANAAVAALSPRVTHVLLCNPDLTFREGFLPTLLKFLNQQPLAAVVAPQLQNEDGSPQASVGAFPTVCGIVADQLRPPEQRKYLRQQPTTDSRIDWAMGACLVFRRDAFEAVGGFDPRFFLYVEEVDLFRRLRNMRRAAWFVPGAAVVHHAPNASRMPRPEVQRWSGRGVLRYFAKHGRIGQLAGYRLLAAASGRLPWSEAFASRRAILERPTGP